MTWKPYLLPSAEKQAFDTIMKLSKDIESDYSRIIFEPEKQTISATNGWVMLELKPSWLKMPRIEHYMQIKMPDGELALRTKNIHIPYKYVFMLDGLALVRVHLKENPAAADWWEKHIPDKLELISEDWNDRIRIEDFLLWAKNNTFIERPKWQKNLFGVEDQSVKFKIAKNKETFDKVLKKINEQWEYAVTEQLITANGVNENDFEYYIVTSTPLSTIR